MDGSYFTKQVASLLQETTLQHLFFLYKSAFYAIFLRFLASMKILACMQKVLNLISELFMVYSMDDELKVRSDKSS